MGGLLSKGEYDLSIFSNKSYLITGKEYWTLTSDGCNISGNYYTCVPGWSSSSCTVNGSYKSYYSP